MPFPPNWPTYIPKDKLAGWFEAYVESMELNYWTATEFEGGTYDEGRERWSVCCAGRTARAREMHPRHVVMATGVSGIPNLPDIPTLRNFAGKVLHSSQYDDGEAWKGKNVLVVGTGNSGHDIAQDLHSSGAKVTLVQRSSDPDRQYRAERAASLRALRRRPSARGLRPHHDVHPAGAGEEEPHPLHRTGEGSWTRNCSTGWSASGSSSISARTERAGSSSTSPAAAATTSTSAAPT